MATQASRRTRELRDIAPVNLVIAQRDMPSILATIVLRSLVGRHHPVDVVWIKSGVYDHDKFKLLLNHGNRKVAFVGVAPDNGPNVIRSMIEAIGNSVGGSVLAVCDVHRRSFWQQYFGNFNQLAITPRNLSEFDSCPGRLLRELFSEVMDDWELKLCDLSHDASEAGGGKLYGIAELIYKVVGDDPKADFYLAHLVDWFAFNDQPSDQIIEWASSSTVVEAK